MKTPLTSPTDGETSVSAAAARLAEQTNVSTATGEFDGE
jgi:hypothetical protein